MLAELGQKSAALTFIAEDIYHPCQAVLWIEI